MKKNNRFLIIMLVISIIINILLSFNYLAVYPENESQKLGLEVQDRPYDYGMMDQLFYGTWLVVEGIWPDENIPERYLRIDNEGKFVEVDYSALIGQEITFGDEYIIHSGEEIGYAYMPMTYTHALPTKSGLINYQYYPETLGLTGSFYSEINFMSEKHQWITGQEPSPNEVSLDDLCYLYPKDNDTIYAYDGGFMYLLKRVM